MSDVYWCVKVSAPGETVMWAMDRKADMSGTGRSARQRFLIREDAVRVAKWFRSDEMPATIVKVTCSVKVHWEIGEGTEMTQENAERVYRAGYLAGLEQAERAVVKFQAGYDKFGVAGSIDALRALEPNGPAPEGKATP